jgi:DNA topoisomerase-1
MNINKAIDTVAERLGNTRTVCKNYYVHPALIEAYQDGKVAPASVALPAKKNRRARPVPALRRDEVAILQFLHDLA